MNRPTTAGLLCSALALGLTLGVALVVAATPSGAQTPEPYRDPDFTCEFIDYGTDPPTLPAPADDPLCTRYDKTNITVSTLGVVDFLAAEPGRVAIVAGKCQYWQQDHWIVRLTPDTVPLIEWQGSYWYDGRAGTAAGILRDLRVGGEPADGEAFIAGLRSVFGDGVADELAPFASPGGGGGASFALPGDFAPEACGASAPSEPEPGPPADPDPGAAPSSPEPPGPGSAERTDPVDEAGSRQGGSTLPRTGGSSGLRAAVGVLLALLAVVHVVGRARVDPLLD